jgi:hypothetical protein
MIRIKNDHEVKSFISRISCDKNEKLNAVSQRDSKVDRKVGWLAMSFGNISS